MNILLKKFFQIESLVVAPTRNSHSEIRVRELLKKDIRLRFYSDQADLRAIAKAFKATHSYFLIDGRKSDLWIPDTRHISHSVFRHFEPHGDIYAYVSKWLYMNAIGLRRRLTPRDEYFETTLGYQSEKVRTKITWVPHTVVPISRPKGEFRKKYGIPSRAILICRIGGYNQFDDSAARAALVELADKYEEFFFVFVNTDKFMEGPNVKYLQGLSERDKWAMYTDGDLFINGRSMGETFGFSIIEPLSVGKPVLAPDVLRHPRMDAHHIQILRPLGLTFLNKNSLMRKIIQITRNEKPDPSLLVRSVEHYNPKQSMELFYSRFIK